jgi:hypothetical protein
MFALRKLGCNLTCSLSHINKVNTIQNALFSSKRPIRRPPVRGKTRSGSNNKTAPPPAAIAVEDSWVGVKDVSSGQIYWWNQVTDETTQLGAPKPTSSSAISDQTQQGVVPIGGQQQQSGGMMSGLGGVMAQGMAFGVGSSVAHSVMGNMFGGSGGSAPVDDDGGGGGGDEWDI